MMTPWERFAAVARGGQADRVPIALIVDSPWLPGYAGVDTLDYFLKTDQWLRINRDLLTRFPDVEWIPGFWIEYGMAAEPSAFGARIMWHHDQPPSIEPVLGGLAALKDVEPADPQYHGFMPLILQRYVDTEQQLLREGINIKMVAARGPFAVAGWMLSMTELMVVLQTEPEATHQLLDTVTTTLIAWLRAQLAVLKAPEGIMVLDDIAGLLSPKLFEEFARPYMTRLFNEFKGMIRIYHNDTPCPHLIKPMANLGFDVFNWSHEMDIAKVQAEMPDIALMGNVSPYAVMVNGTPQEVEEWARECIRKTNKKNLILSAGGGVSPGTPAEAIDALVKVANES
ncbi:MAG TPA: uroporphyrinogen decarboxylase family protein [Anaerolineales bacterium]|nr:uroporphyrinogen decarboxylase family protein [Anaerolineales bacterium]